MKRLCFTVYVVLITMLAVTGSFAGGTKEAASSGAPLRLLLRATDESNILKNAALAYQQKSGMNLSITQIPQDQLEAKLVVEMQSGNPSFDVSEMPYQNLAFYHQYLAPVDKFVSAEDRKDILPIGLQSVTYDDKMYGLQATMTAMIFFYRKDLLDAKGIAVPTTWDDYLRAAQALTMDTPNGKVWGTIVEAKPVEEPVGMFLCFLYQNGADIVDNQGNVTVNSPAAVEALQFAVDLVNKYKVAPPGAVSYWTIDVTNLFKQGQIAMASDWSYAYSAFNAPDSPVKGKVGLALLPGKTRTATTLGGYMLGIFKSTAQPEAAYKLINFMTNTVNQKTMALDGGNTPTRRSTMALPELRSHPLFKAMFDSFQTAVPRNKYPKYAALEIPIERAYSSAISLQQTPQQALDAAAADMKQALQQ